MKQENKSALNTVLEKMLAVFAPENFENYRYDMEARNELKDLFGRAFILLLDSVGEEYKRRVDLDEVAAKTDSLSFEECAQYMIFYLRLYYRNGEIFIYHWLDGTPEKMIKRMMESLAGME